MGGIGSSTEWGRGASSERFRSESYIHGESCYPSSLLVGCLSSCKNIQNAEIAHLTMIGKALITAGAVRDKGPISHHDLSIIGVNVLQYNLIDWCGFIDHASYALSNRCSLGVYPKESNSSLMSYFFNKSYSPVYRLSVWFHWPCKFCAVYQKQLEICILHRGRSRKFSPSKEGRLFSSSLI